MDELNRKLNTRFNPPITDLEWPRLAVTLRDGELASLQVPRSAQVHSIVDDGTWTRLDASNRELSASQIMELAIARGVVSADSQTLPVPFELLDTAVWRLYCETRGLTQGDLRSRTENLALARRNHEELGATRAAAQLVDRDASAGIPESAERGCWGRGADDVFADESPWLVSAALHREH